MNSMDISLVSVIVPVYNVEPYLDICMKSIIYQNYSALEIILVDDGSTDGSAEKCDQWKERDNRITVIHKSNGGLSDARNAGLEIAAGDYIGFIDSDDWIEPDMFEVLVRNMEQYNADVSCCRFSYVYEDGKRVVFGEDHKINIYDGLDGLKEYLYGKTVDPFVCNKLYQAYCIRNNPNRAYSIRFKKGIIGEDNPFNVEVLKHTNRVVVVGEAKYNYLQKRVGAITNSGVSQKKIDSVFWWDRIRQECHEMYPDLEIYAIRRMALFYFGLYMDIFVNSYFKHDARRIRLFAKDYWKKILVSDVCETSIKLATILMTFAPRLYVIANKSYKRIKGEVRL